MVEVPRWVTVIVSVLLMISPVLRTGGRQTGARRPSARRSWPPRPRAVKPRPRRAGRAAPGARAGGIAAGLHLVAYLPDDLDEAAVERAAAARGVAVYGLRPYRLAAVGRPGLIFGYATLDEHTIRTGVEVLAEAIETTMTKNGGGPSAAERC